MTQPKKATKTVTKVSPLSDGQAYIHNKSRGTFHVPLNNSDPQVREQPIVFELGEVRKVDASLLKQQRFIDCVEGNFLEEFTEVQYTAHIKEEAARKSMATKKEAVGNHESGLPNNRTMAIQQIGMIDDSDILEALLEKETRACILAAIEERLEELATSGDIV